MYKKRYWHLKLIGHFYGTVLSSKRKLLSETSYLGDISPHGVFPDLYFDLLTNEIEGKHVTHTCQRVSSIRVKTAGGQCIPLVNGIMNSENASKEMVKSFIDLANMTKGLMDEKQ